MTGNMLLLPPPQLKKAIKQRKPSLFIGLPPWEKYYIPYYRFFVAEESTGNESLEKQGFKCYCAYYVPAVEEKYIANMPLWNGALN